MTAIYARQSVDKKDSLSIEGQIALCRRYAEGEAEVFQDRGYSGKNTRRPAFTKLMQAVEAGEVDRILVYRLDRFSRSIADFSRLWERLERRGVAFQSVTEQFDTASPMGRAMLNIVLVFAQLERETTAQRVRDNYVHRFGLGAWPGGPAPYGYSLTRRTENGRRVSALAPDQHAAVVQRIFRDYACPETSLRSLARQLTAEGIHGPRRQEWDNVTLARILGSPVYVRAGEEVYWHCVRRGAEPRQGPEAFDGIHGCLLLGRRQAAGQQVTVANHPGIVSQELWLQVQEKLAENRQLPKDGAGKYSFLTGLLKCGRCGYALKVRYDRRTDRAALLCSGRSNLGCCGGTVSAELREAEAAVAAELQRLLAENPPEEACPAARETAAELLETEEKIRRLTDALAESSAVSAAYVSRRIEELHRCRRALLERSGETAAPVDFGAASFLEKKRIAALFIDRITVEGDCVRVFWKI